MRIRDNGILGDSRCPHCSHPWHPVPMRGHIGCSVCHTPTADGDNNIRWQGYPAETRKAEITVSETSQRVAA